MVTGSTEPTLLALSFITTTTSTPSVPRSVRSLLDASSFSIAGFTEPLSLALFTSESLTSNESVSSLSPNGSAVLSPSSILSSLHVTNASVVESMSKHGSAERTLSNSIKKQSSFVSAAMSNSSYLSVSSPKSVQSTLHQFPSVSSARYPGATASSNYSNSRPFMSILSLSSGQNASPVTPTFVHSSVLSSSMLSQEFNKVIQTSPFVSNSSSVISDGVSLAPSVSHVDFKTSFFYGSVSTPVPIHSVTQSLLSSIKSSKSYNQSSLVIQQTGTRKASSGFNAMTISSNETSFGTSANFSSPFNLIDLAPTSPLPQPISFTNLGLRTATLSSRVQRARITPAVTNSGFNATTISSIETSFGSSANFTSSFNSLSATPFPLLSQSISFTNLGLRTTTLSSHVQQANITLVVSRQTNSGFNATTISSNETSFRSSAIFTSPLNLISSTPIPPLLQSISSTTSTFRTTTLSPHVQQTGISEAVTTQRSSGINATTISSNESSFTTSTNVNLTSSFDVISVTPTMTASRSVSFNILTFRTTTLPSHVQSMDVSSSASYPIHDARKSSVISTTLLPSVSMNDSRSCSETDSRLAASPLKTSSSSLISSIGRTSFFVTDLQPTPIMSKRHTTFYSSYALLSSYLLTQTFSFHVSPGVESLSSLGTVPSSQSPPRTSWGVMQLSTSVMSHSSLFFHSMVPVSVTMHIPKYSVSSSVDYSMSTDAQPPSTKSKLSSKFSTASASESSLTFPTISHASLISGSKTSSQNGESNLAANDSAIFTAVSSLAYSSISSGSDPQQPNLSKKYSLSTIVNPVQSTSLTIHQAQSSMHIQSSNFGRYLAKSINSAPLILSQLII